MEFLHGIVILIVYGGRESWSTLFKGAFFNLCTAIKSFMFNIISLPSCLVHIMLFNDVNTVKNQWESFILEAAN